MRYIGMCAPGMWGGTPNFALDPGEGDGVREPGVVRWKHGSGEGGGHSAEGQREGPGRQKDQGMSQVVTIPNPGRELALQPPQPPTRNPGWGPRGPRPALHVPAPAAGSVLRIRQRRMKLRREMKGARPPRSGIGILVPNKHQLLLPQTIPGPCCFFRLGAGEEYLLFSPRLHDPLTL